MSDKPKSSVPSVLDPSVVGAEHEAAKTFSGVDPKTFSLAHDAARDLARATSIIDPKAMVTVTEAIKSITAMDSGAVASAAKALGGFDTSKFVASGAFGEFAGAFEGARSIVAPQIAEALSGVMPGGTVSKAIKAFGTPPAFNFAKSIDAAEMASVMGGGISESIKRLDLSEMFGPNFANSVTALGTTVPDNLVPGFEHAAKDAVALAETPAIADPIDESLAESLGWLESLTPAKRRDIVSQALVVIAALVGLAGWLSQSGETKAAAYSLGAAVAVIRLYWMLTDKEN